MTLKRTPLYQKHVALDAKMVPFAGWQMPLSYPAGIIAEHQAVRNSVGIFDIGHMGLIKIEGDEALPLIQKTTTNDASLLELHQGQYSIICNESGGVVDDILVYNLPMYYLIVCNASNTQKVLEWLKKYAQDFKSAKVFLYENYCLLAIQGPQAEGIVSQVLSAPLADLKRNHTLWWRDIIISRTGYTGEEGMELIVSKREVEKIWDIFIEEKIQPCGLGARDTLRLEAGYPLYGQEYDEKTSPLEAGYSWAVKFDKGDFVGKEALRRQKEKGIPRKLVGLEIEDKVIPRTGCPLYTGDNALSIGKVTSGTFSPTFKKPLALAYLESKSAVLGSEVLVEIRGKKISAKIVSKSFYQPPRV